VRIAITGSSGLIGTALTSQLRADGHAVLRLVRRSPRAADEVNWWPHDPDGAVGGAVGGGATRAMAALEGVDAVVNLAGAPIAQGRWTAARKREIRASRVDGTERLAATLAKLRRRPSVLLSGSAIGWYGDTGDQAVTEAAPCGSGFLAGVVRDWEAAAGPAAAAGIRVVRLRTGLVLSADGGLLGRLRPPFRLGLGASLGAGTQFMSWITMADWVSAVGFLLATPEVAGPVNLTAPNPVRNSEFTTALATALRRRALLRVPASALRLALGEAAGEILASSQVLPQRLLAAGYQFRHTSIEAALAQALARPGTAPAPLG
jgi:uncharacterized protein (TIGR01777 family)